MLTHLDNTTPSHPVLYYADSGKEQGFSQASFNPVVEASVQQDRSVLVVHGRFGLECDVIRNWIERGDARFYVNLECPTSYFRESHLVEETEFSFEVPAKDIRQNLAVYIAVVAVRRFKVTADEAYAPVFQGLEIEFEKGDLLAIGGTTSLQLDNATAAGLPVSISRMSESDTRRFYIDPYGHEVVIYLPEDSYQTYNRLGAQAAPFALLVQRGFTEALAALHAKAVADAAEEGKMPEEAIIDTEAQEWLHYVDGVLKDNGGGVELPDGVNSIEWESTESPQSLTCVMEAFFQNISGDALEEISKAMNNANSGESEE